jgi:hypothetical protein
MRTNEQVGDRWNVPSCSACGADAPVIERARNRLQRSDFFPANGTRLAGALRRTDRLLPFALIDLPPASASWADCRAWQPLVFLAASAAFVRSEINRRSFSASSA